jgi:hypothetical protein
MVPGPQQLNVGTTLQSASLWQVFIGGSQSVVAIAQNAGTPPVSAPPAPPFAAPPLAAPPFAAPPVPILPPAPNAPPQTRQVSIPPLPAAPPEERVPPAAPLPPLLPLPLPLEPPVAADPSGVFVDDGPEEHAITIPKSSAMRHHRPAVPKPRLITGHKQLTGHHVYTRFPALGGPRVAQPVPKRGVPPEVGAITTLV